MDDRHARFNARLQLHIRDGWEVVQIDDDPGTLLSALVTKSTVGQPRATGRGVASQSGTPHRYCRRITADRSGVVRVSKVACPPKAMIRSGNDEDMRA